MISTNEFLTFLLSKLMQETGFTNAHVANDDIFEDVGVVVGSSRHDDELSLDFYDDLNVLVLLKV